MCAAHRVVQSFIRPRVSNDNAYIESVFGTLKTRGSYPGVFADLDQARRWVEGFVAGYNDTGHSGLAGYTPNQVAFGTWREVYQRRVAAKQAYDRAHPSRVSACPAGIGVVAECVELQVYRLKTAHVDAAGAVITPTPTTTAPSTAPITPGVVAASSDDTSAPSASSDSGEGGGTVESVLVR